MVIVHLQDYCVYLDIFTKTDMEGVGLKCVKLSTFCILEDYPWADVVALRTLISMTLYIKIDKYVVKFFVHS